MPETDCTHEEESDRLYCHRVHLHVQTFHTVCNVMYVQFVAYLMSSICIEQDLCMS